MIPIEWTFEPREVGVVLSARCMNTGKDAYRYYSPMILEKVTPFKFFLYVQMDADYLTRVLQNEH